MKDETQLSSDVGPRLTRVEYWLMEEVVDSKVSLPWVASPNVGDILNKEGHGVTPKLLAEALAGLFSRRWISAFVRSERDEFYPATEEIEAMFQWPVIPGYKQLSPEEQFKAEMIASEAMTYYQLTPEGGRQWEMFAHPNWNLYISHCRGSLQASGQWEGEIICPTKCFVEQFLTEVDTVGQQGVEGTVEWDVLTPWEATY